MGPCAEFLESANAADDGLLAPPITKSMAGRCHRVIGLAVAVWLGAPGSSRAQRDAPIGAAMSWGRSGDAESSQPYRLIRISHAAIEDFTASSADHQVGVSVVWSKRWW